MWQQVGENPLEEKMFLHTHGVTVYEVTAMLYILQKYVGNPLFVVENSVCRDDS